MSDFDRYMLELEKNAKKECHDFRMRPCLLCENSSMTTNQRISSHVETAALLQRNHKKADHICLITKVLGTEDYI